MRRVTTLGLDLSLVKTGYAVVSSDKTVLESGVIKSKPCGDKPLDELNRILKIVEKIETVVKQYDLDLSNIEGLAFAAKNTTALVQLAALNYFVRSMLQNHQVPFIISMPTTLKKFITGSGKGEKDMMLMAVYKNYGFEALDNNEADGYSLAVCALAVLDNPLIRQNKAQEEVVGLLKKQL